MAVTLTGHFGKPLENAATLLASTSQFQTLTGTASAAAAKAFIHFICELEGSWTRPAVLIYWGDGAGLDKVAGGVSDTLSYWPTGTIVLRFEVARAVAYAADPEDAAKNFINQVDGCIAGMVSAAGASGQLSVSRIYPLSQPAVTSYEQGEGTIYFVWDIGLQLG